MVSAWKGTAATVRECMGCRISQWYAGYFAGDVFTNGTYVSSDERAKQNIADLTGAMKIINQLHPKRYQYRQDGEYGQMNLPRGDRHGLIAQCAGGGASIARFSEGDGVRTRNGWP